MKWTLIKKILIICTLTNLTAVDAAVSTWIGRKKEQSKAYLLKKISEAEQKTKELLTSLRTNTDCLVRGNCPVEKRRQLRALATAVTVTVAAIAAAAVVSRMGSEEEVQLPELAISSPTGKMKTVSRVAIAKKYNIDIESPGRGETPESLLLFAAETGGVALPDVYAHADNVRDNALKAAIEIALQRGNRDVVNYLMNLRKSNKLLLEKVQAGVLQKVKEVYCFVKPSPNSWTIQRAKLRTQERQKQYQEGSTSRRLFTDILNFLHNPICVAE